jgi:polysaccharide pyruvyl transferase WcaK-like protein
MPIEPTGLLQIRAATKRTNTLIAAFPGDIPQLLPLQRAGESILLVDGSRRAFAKLARCTTVLCLRIHLAVFAACCGVHPILLDYSGKVRKVFAGTSVPHTIMAPENVNPEGIAAALDGAAPVSREAVEAAQRECKAHVRKAATAIVAEWKAGGI